MTIKQKEALIKEINNAFVGINLSRFCTEIRIPVNGDTVVYGIVISNEFQDSSRKNLIAHIKASRTHDCIIITPENSKRINMNIMRPIFNQRLVQKTPAAAIHSLPDIIYNVDGAFYIEIEDMVSIPPIITKKLCHIKM